MNLTRLRLAARRAAAWVAHWWQFTSVKLAFVAGAIETVRSTYPEQYAQLLEALPEPVRSLIGPLTMAVAIWARTKPQPDIKPKDTRNGQ